jgi:hypothetical protein
MDILNLGGAPEPSERPSKKKLKVVIGIGLLAGFMGMGSTLAATITLNGGTAVEFGQGVQYVTACDNAITVTPTSEFVNSSADGQSNFALKSIVLSNIADTCIGKKIRINAYTNSDTNTVYTVAGDRISSPIAFTWIYTGATTNFGGKPVSGAAAANTGCEFTIASNWTSSTVSCDLNGAGTDKSAAYTFTPTSGSLSLVFNSATIDTAYAKPVLAAAIDKFALESNA